MLVNFKMPVSAIPDPRQRAEAEKLGDAKGEISLSKLTDHLDTLKSSQALLDGDPDVREQIGASEELARTILSAATKSLRAALHDVVVEDTTSMIGAIEQCLPPLDAEGMIADFALPTNAIADPRQRAVAESIAVQGEVSLAALEQSIATGPGDAPAAEVLRRTMLGASSQTLQIAIAGIVPADTSRLLDAVNQALPPVQNEILDGTQRIFDVGLLPDEFQESAFEVHRHDRDAKEGIPPYVSLPSLQRSIDFLGQHAREMGPDAEAVFQNLQDLNTFLQKQVA